MTMQYFQDPAGACYAFEPDVLVIETNGIYSFKDARGQLLSVPTTLAPCTNNVPPAPSLAQAQAQQTATVKSACSAAIVVGFSSSALGSAHTYGSQPADQANTDRACIAGGLLWCADSTGAWSLINHTAAQAQQVRTDLWSHIQTSQSHYASLLAQISAATTVAAVEAISW